MATYSEQTKAALKISAAAATIIKALDPLSQRSKRRVLLFFYDLVQDPAEECTFAQLELARSAARRSFALILKEVAKHLGIEDLV